MSNLNADVNLYIKIRFEKLYGAFELHNYLRE